MKNIKVTLTFNKQAQSRDELGDILVSFDWKGEHYDWELTEQLSYSAYKMMIWLDDSSEQLDELIEAEDIDATSTEAIKTAIRSQAEKDAMQAWWPIDPGVMPIAYNNKVWVSTSPGALYGDTTFLEEVEFSVRIAKNFDSAQNTEDLQYEEIDGYTPTGEYIYKYEDVIPFVKLMYEEHVSDKHEDLEWNTDLEKQIKCSFITSSQGYVSKAPGYGLEIEPSDFVTGMQFTGLEDLYAYLGQLSGMSNQIKHVVKIQYDYNGIFTNKDFDFDGVGAGYNTAKYPLRECFKFPQLREKEIDQIENIFNELMTKINQVEPATNTQVKDFINKGWDMDIDDLGENPNISVGLELNKDNLNV